MLQEVYFHFFIYLFFFFGGGGVFLLVANNIENTCPVFCFLRSKCVMWRVRWLFPQAGMEYVDNRYSKEKEI